MTITLHPHAQARLIERGATADEVMTTVERGRSSPADYGRTRFRYRFPFNTEWRGTVYETKQIDAIAVSENEIDWLVITVIVKFF
jgi:hypothetical protein